MIEVEVEYCADCPFRDRDAPIYPWCSILSKNMREQDVGVPSKCPLRDESAVVSLKEET